MKIKAKASFYDANGLHRKDDVVEIETAAFNPAFMTEVPEARAEKKVTVEAKPKKTIKKKG